MPNCQRTLQPMEKFVMLNFLRSYFGNPKLYFECLAHSCQHFRMPHSIDIGRVSATAAEVPRARFQAGFHQSFHLGGLWGCQWRISNKLPI